MYISNEFEQKFVLELNDLHQFIIRGIMLRHEMIDDWFEIKGQICIMLSQLRHMSISEAEVYIDLVTGYFSPGRKLSVCPDDCLIPLYSRSHHICALLNTLNWKMSGNYILGYIKSKYDEIKKMIETYRSVLGESEGNKRIAEILDAYPHLKNTFIIKGVSKHSMDIKTCFIDARINYYFDSYDVKKIATERGIKDDIIFEYRKSRMNKENIKDARYVKPTYLFNIEKNGKLYQGWNQYKVNEKTEYKGQHIDEMKNGYGTLTVKKGNLYLTSTEVYHGSFVNEVKEGYGVCLYENGDCYEGWWKANDWYGPGVLHTCDGKTIKGYFKHNQLVSETNLFEPLRVAPLKINNTKVDVKKENKPISVSKPIEAKEEKKVSTSTSYVAGKTTNTIPSSNVSLKTENKKIEVKTPSIKNETTVNKSKPTNERYKDTITFPNGDFYTGYFLNGKFDGKGKMYYKNGNIYEGEWKDGKRHGKAIFRNKDIKYFKCEFINDVPTNHVINESYNGVYEGEWKNYKINGKGKFTSKTGDVYEGEFKDGSITGKGVFKYSDGSVYEGNLIDGIYEGYGVYKSNYGYKYEGYWKDGKHHGKGTYYYSNGGKYVGDFVDDEYEGFGILYMDNSTMEGQFKKGRLNGKGKITYSDGSYYNGEVSDNIANGHGEKVYVNGDRYVGMFLYGKFHGKGALYFNNGNIYVGEFKNNYYEGKGTFYYLNGTRYEGEFLNGKWHGKGKLYYIDGGIEEQIYENGNFISGKIIDQRQPSNIYKFKPVKGINYSNGFYAGEVINDVPNGFGIMLYSNGDFFIGQFDNCKLNGFGLYLHTNLNKITAGKFTNGVINGVGMEVLSNNTASIGNYLNGDMINEVRFIDYLDYNFNIQRFTINMQLFNEMGYSYFGGISSDNYFDIAGVICYASGINYIGQYNRGQQSGLGIKTYTDGSFYIGMFNNGAIHGYGILIKDGTMKVGYWENNCFIK